MVIAIIGLLASISVIALNTARAKARDTKRVADVKQISTALELYFNDAGRYPTAAEFTTGSLYSTSTNGTTTYMATVPLAPDPPDGNCSQANNNYNYVETENGAGYQLVFCLGGRTGSLNSNCVQASPTGMVNTNSNPLCIVGLKLWLDAADTSTLFSDGDCSIPAAADGLVGCWHDKSGNNNDARQVSGPSQAVRKDGVQNGKTALRFDGTNDFYSHNNITDERTIFFVIKHADGDQVYLGYDYDAPLGHSVSFNWSGGNAFPGSTFLSPFASPYILNGAAYDDAATTNAISIPKPYPNFHIYSFVTTDNVESEYIANDRNTPSYYWEGDIAELIIYNVPLTDADRLSIQNYLNDKYHIY